MFQSLTHFALVLLNLDGNVGRRIFQGRDALIGEFPYVANWGRFIEHGRRSDFYPFCTCSIIAPTWTVSAAHCMDKPPLLTRYFIYYGSHLPTHAGNFSEVLQAIPHPNYDFDDEFYFTRFDICLLRTKPIQISQYAILSAVDYKTLIGQEVYVVGYGMTNVSSKVDLAFMVKKPLQVFKGMVSRCLKNGKEIESDLICVSSPCGSLAMVCGGDSGGPSIHTSGIVGVHAWRDVDCDSRVSLNKIHKHSLAGVSSGGMSPISVVLDWVSLNMASVT